MKPYRFRAALIKILLQFGNPIKAGLIAGSVYFLLAILHGKPWDVSDVPYFNYLADAFLHGQLNLRLLPPTTHDLVFYSGNYYLYWPPFPAVALMPFVAMFGVNFSDILFTILIGGLDIYLVGLLLSQVARKSILFLSDLQRSFLTLFFAFGTVFLTLAPLGRVWFTSQLIGLLFVLLSFIFAISLSSTYGSLLSGIALACALSTRNNLVFAGIWPAAYLIWKDWELAWLPRARNFLLFVIPIITAVSLLAVYNGARFHSPFEVGLTYHQMASIYTTDFAKYGPFNIHYFWTNIKYQYLYYPFPIRGEFFMGGSMFLLSPLFFASIWSPFTKYPAWSRVCLITSILLINIPILLLMGTGWVQFGPRYTLDFSIPMLLLTAMGISKWNNRALSVSVLASILQYLVGVSILLKSV